MPPECARWVVLKMSAEIWDLYDARGQKTGKTMVRGEEVPSGLYHIGVHIWPINARGEFLIQRRAMGVQWKPGIWAVTGGSAVSGEDALVAARRELQEELGYTASEQEMHLVMRLRRSNSFCSVYAVRINCPAEQFALQQEEVSAVKWCASGQLMQMIAVGAMYNYGDLYFKTLFKYQKNVMRAQ